MKDRKLKEFFAVHDNMPADNGFTQRVMNETCYYRPRHCYSERSFNWVIYLSAVLGILIAVLSGGFMPMLDNALQVLSDFTTTFSFVNYFSAIILLSSVAGGVILLNIIEE